MDEEQISNGEEIEQNNINGQLGEENEETILSLEDAKKYVRKIGSRLRLREIYFFLFIY